VAARFEVFRYEVRRDGAVPETRYSLAPMKGVRTAGRDEPLGATPQQSGPGGTDQHVTAGEVEAPDGTTVATTDPPVLEIPGQGRVDLHAVIGVGSGEAGALGDLVTWHPRG
jgi:hypothetical protein